MLVRKDGLTARSAGRYDWFLRRRDGGNDVEALRAALLRYRYGRHAHETYSIGVAEQGSQTFWHCGSHYRTKPGSVILFNPFELHDGNATDEVGVVYRMLYPDAARLNAAAEEQGVGGGLGFAAPIAWDPALAGAISAYAQSLDAGGEKLAGARAVEERYQLLVAHLVRHARARWPASGGEAERALSRVREEMHDSFAEPLTIGRLAQTAGLGRYRLIRAFHRRFGLPPSAYLRALRLEEAKRLLGAGEAPAAAAAAVGLTDQSHLTRLFKQTYGVTPGAYHAALGR